MMEPVDWDSLRENCAGDESLVVEVLDLFRKEADVLVGDIAKAVGAADAVAVKRTAHRLKGALVSLGAKPSTDLARALEVCGSGGDLTTAPELFAQLQHEIARLLTAINMPHAA